MKDLEYFTFAVGGMLKIPKSNWTSAYASQYVCEVSLTFGAY